MRVFFRIYCKHWILPGEFFLEFTTQVCFAPPLTLPPSSRISLRTVSSSACFLYFWWEWSFLHLLSVKSTEDKKVALSFPVAWLTVFSRSQSKVVGSEELLYHKSVWDKNSLYIFVMIKSLKLPDDKWAP